MDTERRNCSRRHKGKREESLNCSREREEGKRREQELLRDR